MASSSWFARSKSHDRDYELPRWSPPSRMAASVIPPPIVESIHKTSVSTSTVLPTRSSIIERASTSTNHEVEIEADLQFLLDAQAEALLQGLSEHDGNSSNSDITPTASSKNDSMRHVNRPIRKKLGLRTARKGIYSCMMALSAIKSEEEQAIKRSLQRETDDLARIDTWESKKQGLQAATSKVDEDEDSIRIQRLRKESDTLQEEINKIELQLMELKTKQRRILKQAATIENTVQAKLASYTTSLKLLENDITAFLTSRPSTEPSIPTTDGQQSLWELPPDRRTLTLAKDHITNEQADTQKHLERVQVERDALDHGSKLWKEVILKLADYEREIRHEIGALKGTMIDSTTAWDDPPQATALARPHDLGLKLMSLISDLGKHVRYAEEKNWRLLVAAIGAELDALQRGKEVYDRLFGSPDDEDVLSARQRVDHESSLSSNNDQATSSNGHTNKRQYRPRSDIDDEPDPELLFSVQDDDVND